MIQVGIQENLRFVKVEKNDKGTLVVTIQQGDSSSDSLDALGQVTTTTDSENTFFFWPIKADDRLSTPEAIGNDLFTRFIDFRNQLSHILEQFMPVKGLNFQPTNGLPTLTTKTELINALGDPQTRDIVTTKMYDNYITAFINYMAPVAGPGCPAVRMKLTRASKDKHFANLPRFIPFIEPMTIPSDKTRLKFTDYELGFRAGNTKGDKSTYTGHDQSDPTPAATENGNVPSAEAAAVEALFPARK